MKGTSTAVNAAPMSHTSSHSSIRQGANQIPQTNTSMSPCSDLPAALPSPDTSKTSETRRQLDLFAVASTNYSDGSQRLTNQGDFFNLLESDAGVQVPEWDMGDGSIPFQFPGLDLNGFTFLEEALLPDFSYDPTELLFPPQAMTNAARNGNPIQVPTEILLSHTRNVTPLPEEEDQSGRPDTTSNRSRGLHLSPDDINRFTKRLSELNSPQRLCGFDCSSRSRMSRFLNAYFEYFDPHTPIVHRATFDVSNSHPALVLAMLAIGGLHLCEHKTARAAYQASCQLLAQYEPSVSDENESAMPDLWHIQASLLCVEFGAFSDNIAYLHRAERQLSSVAGFLRESATAIQRHRLSHDLDWRTWLQLETYSRLACWAVVLNGVVLSFDPFAISMVAQQEVILPLPCDEYLWQTRSATEWKNSGGPNSQLAAVDLWSSAKAIFNGQHCTARVSSFGLLALVGFILANICYHERLLIGVVEGLDEGFVRKMEKSLAIWETAWRRHPQAAGILSKHGNPLMTDSLSLLGTAYYHLYVGSELHTLKRIANSPSQHISMPTYRSPELALKAVKYAANSWFVRVKIGIAHLQKTAALEFGGHSLVTAYEGALILSWWLSTMKDASHPLNRATTQPGDRKALHDLFADIFTELEGQDIKCDVTSQRELIPLACYRMLMRPWVWTYSSIMDRQLATLAVKLTPSSPVAQL